MEHNFTRNLAKKHFEFAIEKYPQFVQFDGEILFNRGFLKHFYYLEMIRFDSIIKKLDLF